MNRSRFQRLKQNIPTLYNTPMRKRDLEIILEGLEKQTSFDPALEQYPTPPIIVYDYNIWHT